MKNSSFRDFLRSNFALKKEHILEQEQEQEQEDREVLIYSKEETFALALGDLENERILLELNNQSLLEYLKTTWEREFDKESGKDDVIYTLQHLWSRGSLSLIHEYKAFSEEVRVRDMVAFDSARFTELLCQALYLKFLEEEEAWGLLFLNAQRVQDCFEDWKDFQRAYFRGLALYKYSLSEKSEENDLPEYKRILLKIKSTSSVELEWLDEKVFSQFKIDETIIKE